MDSIRQKAQRIQLVQIDQSLDNAEKIASVPLGIWLIEVSRLKNFVIHNSLYRSLKTSQKALFIRQVTF